jgi:hypothetical protein
VSSVSFLCSGLITTMAMMSSAVGGAEHITFTPAQVRCGVVWCGVVGLQDCPCVQAARHARLTRADTLLTPPSASHAQDLGIYGGVIALIAILNSTGLRVLTCCTQLGGVFHLAGIVLLALMVPLMATTRQPAIGITNPL